VYFFFLLLFFSISWIVLTFLKHITTCFCFFYHFCWNISEYYYESIGFTFPFTFHPHFVTNKKRSVLIRVMKKKKKRYICLKRICFMNSKHEGFILQDLEISSILFISWSLLIRINRFHSELVVFDFDLPVGNLQFIFESFLFLHFSISLVIFQTNLINDCRITSKNYT